MLPLARSLAGEFSVFAPELPGYGRSEKPRVPLGISGLAAALAGCLDALELDRPALVANSMGCQVVTDLAARLPELVGPLALIGPTVDPAQRLARRQLVGGLRDTTREPLSMVALAARDGAGIGLRALLATARSALADRIEQRLPLIEQPTLVLRGEEDRFISSAWPSRSLSYCRGPGSWPSPVSPTPSSTRGRLSSRTSFASCSSKAAQTRLPHRYPLARGGRIASPGKARYHSLATNAGINRSSISSRHAAT
jgi:pimeloyl-ACP methyl ester carboxylesterase